jgi:ABC-2 type transport system ATP-binding protein
MIQAHDLTKTFGSLVAVDHLNLDIRAGEFFAFLGPNAAGKTTTIKLLTGLMRPTEGRAIIGGFDIQKQPMEAKKLIAFVPDFPFAYEKLDPEEFLMFVGEIYGMSRAVIRERSDELFERFNLQEFRNKLIESLSHGTRQRVVLSSALLHDPKVIIIDEPMVGLDPRSARIVKDALKERARNGATVFLSTHQLSVAEELADRIGIINNGRLVAMGTLEQIRKQRGADNSLESIFLELTREDENAPLPTAM